MKISKKVKVRHDLGLHTRPATQIVKLLQSFKSSVSFTYKKDTINARSIMSILILAVGKNSQVLITAEGEDAKQVMEALEKLFEEGFESIS